METATKEHVPLNTPPDPYYDELNRLFSSLPTRKPERLILWLPSRKIRMVEQVRTVRNCDPFDSGFITDTRSRSEGDLGEDRGGCFCWNSCNNLGSDSIFGMDGQNSRYAQFALRVQSAIRSDRVCHHGNSKSWGNIAGAYRSSQNGPRGIYANRGAGRTGAGSDIDKQRRCESAQSVPGRLSLDEFLDSEDTSEPKPTLSRTLIPGTIQCVQVLTNLVPTVSGRMIRQSGRSTPITR